ncbi:MAG: hypothetical protein PHD97_08615 [Bacteroidales bacterium]|nr:hypothetical protein [Bacteroidales bacterium]
MTDINSYLTKLSKQLSIGKEEREEIDKSIDFLKGKIWEKYRDKLLTVDVFGSYDRRTELPQSVDKNSDVDILVIFKSNDFQPSTILKHLYEFADNQYSKSNVMTDHPTVVIELKKIRFEIIPAYWETYFLSDDELKIPAPRNKELKWITTDPAKLKNDLMDKNKKEDEMIIPLIKLIKYFNTLQGKPYESHLIERFAISRRYPEKQLQDYFFKFIENLDTDGQNEEQKIFIEEMKNRKENLIALEKRNLVEYIEQELQKFLPLISV